MKETITATDPRIMRLTAQADDITTMCHRLREKYHPLLRGKRFITDAMLSELLGVSRRTTQDYRDRGIIPYYRLDGKILYAEEDIEAFLQSNYRPNSTEKITAAKLIARLPLFFFLTVCCQFIIAQSNLLRILAISSYMVLSCILA